jgi:hypothetical protein
MMVRTSGGKTYDADMAMLVIGRCTRAAVTAEGSKTLILSSGSRLYLRSEGALCLSTVNPWSS